jgi:hypothetical protein
VVLTENDYYDMLIAMAGNLKPVPAMIQKKLQASTLLFIGYSLADSTFRVLSRSLSSMLPRGFQNRGIFVQPPIANKAATEYLEKYYDSLELSTYWGTGEEFARDLRQRWNTP